MGTRALHAPHSPSASSDTPEKLIPHSGHSLESSGIMALQEPHSAIGISFFFSVGHLTPNSRNTTHDIMVDGYFSLKCIYDWSYWKTGGQWS